MRILLLMTMWVPVIVLWGAASAWSQAPDAARVAEIAEWMTEETYSPVRSIEDRDFWKRVAAAGPYRKLVKQAEEDARQAIEPLPDSLYLEYSRTGNRSRYEGVYFAKLRTLRRLVIAECIENRGRYLPPIEQLIASYAADRSWVLPAHDAGQENFEGRQITIDLFSSEVACDLATTDFMLGDRLSEGTRSTVRREVKRRIFDPYMSMLTTGRPRMWWITGTNNWNAVCLANVTGTALALLESPAERAFYAAAAEKNIEWFLEGFTDDGYCSEGIGYWNYGFGCFVRLAHMLYEATGANSDLFVLPKARNAALFARRMEITPGCYPAFADCSVGSEPSVAVMAYVSRCYELPFTPRELKPLPMVRWLDELGVFSFTFDEPIVQPEIFAPALRDWFEQAGILISRGATTKQGLPMGVALKGGHNEEHHNHNDVGSFVVCIGGSMTLVDPGAEVYTRRTFSDQRYVSNVLNSFGHPVPRVAGQLQQTGRAAAAKVLKLEQTDAADTLVLDMSAAYAVEELKGLTRTFVYHRSPACLTVEDQVEFASPQSFGTALITFDAWRQTEDQRILIGEGESAVIVQLDTGSVPYQIEATTLEEDVRGGKQPVRIGIELTSPVSQAKVVMSIRPATDVD